MFISFLGALSLLFGFLILLLPLILTELSRPRDWLMGSLFLCVGLLLLEENALLSLPLKLLVISGATLLGKMLFEISQSRWYQLSSFEKNRVASIDRWIQSIKQFGQIVIQFSKGVFDFVKIFKNHSRESLKKKKWVHPDLKKENQKQNVDLSDDIQSKKSSNEESTESEESS